MPRAAMQHAEATKKRARRKTQRIGLPLNGSRVSNAVALLWYAIIFILPTAAGACISEARGCQRLKLPPLALTFL